LSPFFFNSALEYAIRGVR